MDVHQEFVDYYDFLGISPTAVRDELVTRIRAMYKIWHPDVCHNVRAHEMTVKIGEAKELLLDEQRRKQYDDVRRAYLAEQSSGSERRSWSRSDEWESQARQARDAGQKSAELRLEDILGGLVGLLVAGAAVTVGAAIIGTEYAWKGTDRYHDAKSRKSFLQLFWCGIAGWACVICLVAPGTSIITFFCFYWAFFPAPERKFVGFGSVLTGMVYSLVVIIPLLLILIKLVFGPNAY